MLVRLYKSQLDYFRRKARDSKVEILAHLYGHRKALDTVEIRYFMYPELEIQTETCVKAVALERQIDDLSFVGTIHSHPNALPLLSSADYKGSIIDGEIIAGICEVRDRKTRVVWWTPSCALQCSYEFIKTT